MKQYITMNKTTNKVTSEGLTRKEAVDNLKLVALEGETYLELKVLGLPLELRTRTVTVIASVATKEGADPAEPCEDDEED